MKNFLFLFVLLLAVVSCEPETLNDNYETATEFIDPEEECPEWDRCNCNGVPDSEESPNPCE